MPSGEQEDGRKDFRAERFSLYLKAQAQRGNNMVFSTFSGVCVVLYDVHTVLGFEEVSPSDETLEWLGTCNLLRFTSVDFQRSSSSS